MSSGDDWDASDEEAAKPVAPSLPAVVKGKGRFADEDVEEDVKVNLARHRHGDDDADDAMERRSRGKTATTKSRRVKASLRAPPPSGRRVSPRPRLQSARLQRLLA